MEPNAQRSDDWQRTKTVLDALVREAEERVGRTWLAHVETVLELSGVGRDEPEHAALVERATRASLDGLGLTPPTRDLEASFQALRVAKQLRRAWDEAAEDPELDALEEFQRRIEELAPSPPEAVHALARLEAEAGAQGNGPSLWPMELVGESASDAMEDALSSLAARVGAPAPSFAPPRLDRPLMARTDAAAAVDVVADWLNEREQWARAVAALAPSLRTAARG